MSIFLYLHLHQKIVNGQQICVELLFQSNVFIFFKENIAKTALFNLSLHIQNFQNLTKKFSVHIPMEWGNQDSLLSRTKQEMKDCINIANRDLIGSQVEVEWNEFRNEIMGKHFDRMFVQITNLIAWMLMDSSALNDYGLKFGKQNWICSVFAPFSLADSPF